MTQIINKFLFDGTLSKRQMKALDERLETISSAMLVAAVFTAMMSGIWLIQIMRGIA